MIRTPNWNCILNCGGFARVATICRHIRSSAKGGTLLVDCGDAIHGTAPAQWSKGAAIVPPLNALGIDVMTPGKWEFGFGPEALRTYLKQHSPVEPRITNAKLVAI